jgi:hypothetical protein
MRAALERFLCARVVESPRSGVRRKLVGFAGLGYAGHRRAGARRTTLAAQFAIDALDRPIAKRALAPASATLAAGRGNGAVAISDPF